ncbi:hypothetical protein LINPERPRIM_LOCUS16602 [Linum perenne]
MVLPLTLLSLGWWFSGHLYESLCM